MASLPHITEQELANRVMHNPLHNPELLPNNGFEKQAAVLVPFMRVDDSWHILFIRRSDTVHDHKGQVAFPGGAMEPEDVDLEETALREAEEEIGLQAANVRLWGRLPTQTTVSKFLVTPVVGHILSPFVVRLCPEEVSRVFTMPLEWLANPENREKRLFTRSEGQTWPVIFFKEYQGETLWGATAAMVVNLLKILALAD